MISYFVNYDGQADDPQSFYDYYRDRHGEILSRFEGISGLLLHRPVEWNDPFSVNKGSSSLIAQMKFDSQAALDAALTSGAREEARRDFQNFPQFNGSVFHQAMKAEKVFG